MCTDVFLSYPRKRRINCTEEEPQLSGCTYCLHWKKQRDGTWKLIDVKSTLKHGPTCVSSQKVTVDELVHDPNFVQYTLGHVNVTAKNVARAQLTVVRDLTVPSTNV